VFGDCAVVSAVVGDHVTVWVGNVGVVVVVVGATVVVVVVGATVVVVVVGATVVVVVVGATVVVVVVGATSLLTVTRADKALKSPAVVRPSACRVCGPAGVLPGTVTGRLKVPSCNTIVVPSSVGVENNQTFTVDPGLKPTPVTVVSAPEFKMMHELSYEAEPVPVARAM
jgi:hypothetical protein